ncbi:hypothetical protein MRX96_005343 [Rhipicephalus microplus]
MRPARTHRNPLLTRAPLGVAIASVSHQHGVFPRVCRVVHVSWVRLSASNVAPLTTRAFATLCLPCDRERKRRWAPHLGFVHCLGAGWGASPVRHRRTRSRQSETLGNRQRQSNVELGRLFFMSCDLSVRTIVPRTTPKLSLQASNHRK